MAVVPHKYNTMEQLKTSLDWQDIEKELRQLGKSSPEFKFNIIKFCAGISSEVRKLSDIEIDIRRRPSDMLLVKHRDQANKINDAIKLFSQTHLLHLFSKVD
jgi:hypothetical protein